MVKYWLPLGALAVAFAWAGCSAGDVIDDEGASSTSTTTGGAGGDAPTGSGGAGGSGGGTTGACGMDCSAIDTPDCFISVCNEGNYAGPIGSCVVVPDVDGTVCDDGLFCTVEDTCQAGVCTGGPQNDCGMTPPECTEVTCDEGAKSCSTAPLVNGTTCTPGSLCETGGACQNGLCVGTPKDCFFSPVPSECFNAECNPANGMCEPVAGNDGQTCVDQNDLCSDGNTCSAGVCSGGSPKNCSFLTDGCDLGVCDPVNGNCTTMAVMNGQVCDDLDACTTGELCTNGMCGGGSAVTACSGATVSDGCCPSTCTVANDLDCACNTGDIVLEEVSTGGPDFVLLRNDSSCALDIDPITVCVDDGFSGGGCQDLPTFSLQPNETIYLVENFGNLPTGQNAINLTYSMGYEGGAGSAWLCDGTCTTSSAANVTDAVIWGTSTAVTLPPPINFTPAPVTGVSSTLKSVVRQTVSGNPPNFFQSDWVAGTPSHGI